jgi:hypothetical protein
MLVRKLRSGVNWQGALKQEGVKQRLGALGDTVEICRHGDLAPGIYAPLFLLQDDFARGETHSLGQKSPPLMDSGALLPYLQRTLYRYREPVCALTANILLSL